MSSTRFDVLVVGAGPAGSIAATVLARAGAEVALVDKARFPRDKACGDLVGPRGLQVLADLRLPEPDGLDVGDMIVVGPSGHRVRLPSVDGRSYPGRARAVTRAVLDDHLRRAAIEAGAHPVEGRVDRPLLDGASVGGFAVGDGHELRADFVIGADGATSRVAEAAGLVDSRLVLWGFAVRSYLEGPSDASSDRSSDASPDRSSEGPPDASPDRSSEGPPDAPPAAPFDAPVELPTIVLWEQERRRAFPGYGWIFPGPGGTANLGVGIGTLADRQLGSAAVRVLPDFLDHLCGLGLIRHTPAESSLRRLGGWLKMGMVGTVPADGNVLLAGDAAGLVNPLQGEGIAQAMTSGRSAAESILQRPGHAAAEYRSRLARAHLPYQRITAAAHRWLVRRPGAVAGVGRLITSPLVGPAVAGGWGIFWNELLDGAAPGAAGRMATAATFFGRAVTSCTEVTRWFDRHYRESTAARVESGPD